jgi:hypothetical protein
MNRSLPLIFSIVVLSLLLSSCDGDSSDSLDPDADGGAGTDSEAAYCANLQPTGSGIGQVAQNWTLTDADGIAHNLHDYCGQVVYLEVGPQW